jgi:hypothetical protein
LDNLDVTFEFVNKTKGYNKTNQTIPHSKCKNDDFPSNLYKSFNEANIRNFECIDLKNLSDYSYIPKGIYTDDKFKYYQISVKLKDNLNDTIKEEIYKFLRENDCKLQFY